MRAWLRSRIAFAAPVAIIANAALLPGQEPRLTHDERAVVSVVDSFHNALTEGDSAAAMRFLSQDAVVLEHGALESRSEYAGHHLRPVFNSCDF